MGNVYILQNYFSKFCMVNYCDHHLSVVHHQQFVWHSRDHSSDPIFIKLAQNVFLYKIYVQFKVWSLEIKNKVAMANQRKIWYQVGRTIPPLFLAGLGHFPSCNIIRGGHFPSHLFAQRGQFPPPLIFGIWRTIPPPPPPPPFEWVSFTSIFCSRAN